MIKLKLLISISFILLMVNSYGQNQEVNILVKRGVELHDKGEFKEAIETYKKALKIDPNSSLANYEIASTYFHQQDYKNAELHSKKVIDQNDKNQLLAYIVYGNSLDMQGQTKEAIKSYERAMKDFDNFLLYYNYAITCLNSGDEEKAYESAIKAIKNNPSHSSSHLLLSKIMEKKGSRIKAMLPLYFFLLLEPNSTRSKVEYQNLRNYIDKGIAKSAENTINVLVPMDNDADFSAAEMAISLSKASNTIEENKGKRDLDLFAENNNMIFSILGELKKENTGFWWEFYVPFFSDLSKEKFTRPYTYYISLSEGEEAISWIESNTEEFEKFKNWMNKK